MTDNEKLINMTYHVPNLTNYASVSTCLKCTILCSQSNSEYFYIHCAIVKVMSRFDSGTFEAH